MKAEVANILFTLGGLSMLGATLTLPGLAGLVLSIGIAVDANVLIFERIREELRHGKTVRLAVDELLDDRPDKSGARQSERRTRIAIEGVFCGPRRGAETAQPRLEGRSVWPHVLCVAAQQLADLVGAEPSAYEALEHAIARDRIDETVLRIRSVRGKRYHYLRNYIPGEGFPTLNRYKTILSQRELLEQFDYLYYMDVDMLAVDTIGDEILGDLVAVQHPGFIGKVGTPERRSRSAASGGRGLSDRTATPVWMPASPPG